ncbi:MAG: ABC transporter ATP-binding protein [Xanthobacteraceae bacterium]|nr:MAG: ABC transporter ATP-binding protein [Xanthobacteraceae bacterium]
MTTPILTAEDVSVAYGKVEAVRGVSLAIPQGQIVTLIGANGAGKTSLLNALMGLLPSAGRVSFRDEAMASVVAEERVARGLSLVSERRDLFATMTVEDNLELGGFRTAASARAAAMEDVFARFPRLRERRRQVAGTLSGGERQMLAMGRALVGRPRLLMLDEPSLGLAPRIVRDIFHIIKALMQTGVSILLVEQNARAAMQIADYAYVMELGEITVHGPAAELARDPKIIESYLGLGHHR